METDRLTRSFNALKTEVTAMSAANSANDEVRKLAQDVLSRDKLDRQLVDLLIGKVFIYPGNRVEIGWKVVGFGSKMGRKS